MSVKMEIEVTRRLRDVIYKDRDDLEVTRKIFHLDEKFLSVCLIITQPSEKFLRSILTGLITSHEHNMQDAVNNFNNAMKMDIFKKKWKLFLDIYLVRGINYFRLQRDAECIEDIEMYLKNGGHKLQQAYACKSATLYRQKKYMEAAVAGEMSMKLAIKDANYEEYHNSLIKLAYCYFDMLHMEVAANLFKLAIPAEHEDIADLVTYGMCLSLTHKHQQAIEIFEQALSLEGPTKVYRQIFAPYCYSLAHLKKIKETLLLMDRGTEFAMKTKDYGLLEEIIIDRVGLLNIMNKLEESIRCIEKYYKFLRPKIAFTLFERTGDLLMERSSKSLAILAFNYCLSLNPRDWKTAMLLITLTIIEESYLEGLVYCNIAHKTFPEHERTILLVKCMLAIKAQKYERAKKDIMDIMDKYPGDVQFQKLDKILDRELQLVQASLK